MIEIIEIRDLFNEIRNLFKKFIKATSDERLKKSDEIFDLIDKINDCALELTDKIYKNANRDTDEKNNRVEINLKPAAKAYLLAALVFKEGARSIPDLDKSMIITEAAMSCQRQAEQILQDEVLLCEKKAYQYEKRLTDWARNIKSTEMRNKASALEYQIKIGSSKKLEKEIQAEYESIYNDVFQTIETPNEGLKSEVQSDIIKALTFKGSSIPYINPSHINIKSDYVHSSLSDKDYDWWIYLDVNSNIKEHIESVTYTLHPTFPRAVQNVVDPSNGFRLDATGWKEFQIKIDIHLKNGGTITKYHWLDLGISQTLDYTNLALPDAITGG